MNHTMKFFGKSIQEWLTALSDVDEEVRASAAWALSAFGSQAIATVPALIDALSDEDQNVRSAAAMALGFIGPDSEDAILALVNGLQDEEYWVRRAVSDQLASMGSLAVPRLVNALRQENQNARADAAQTLGKMASEAADAVPALIEALGDEDETVRERAAQSLGEIGRGALESVDSLMLASHDTSPSVRGQVAEALGKVGDQSAIPVLVAMLSDSSEPVAAAAADALGRIGQATDDVLSALMEALVNSDSRSFRGAIDALSTLGADAVSWVVRALQNEDSRVRTGVVEILGKMGPAAQDSVPALIRALRDEEAFVRLQAVAALGKIGMVATGVVPALIDAVTDKDASVRKQAVEVLGTISPTSEVITSTLLDALGDENRGVRGIAVRALGNIIPERTDLLPVMLRLASDRSEGDLRPAAMDALGSIGAISEDVVPALIWALDDEDRYIRRSAARALGGIGPQAVAAVPALIDLLDSESHATTIQELMSSDRAVAAGALGRMGTAKAEVLSALVRAVADSEVRVRDSAIHSLQRLGEVSDEVVIALLDALEDESDYVRWAAANTLGDFGAVSEAVVPALVGTLNDEQWFVRKAGAEALAKIGPSAKAAVPSLEGLWMDTHVREAAALALYRIGPISDEEREKLQGLMDDLEGEEESEDLPGIVIQAGPPQGFGFLEVSTEGTKALSGGGGVERLILWDVSSGLELRRIAVGENLVFLKAAAFAPDGSHALICGNGSANYWNLADGNKVKQLKVENSIASAVFTPDGSKVLLADGNRAILRDIATGRALHKLQNESLQIEAVTISPNGSRIVTGDEKTAIIWDSTSGIEYDRISTQAPVGALAYSQDGACLFVAGGETIYIYEVDNGRVVRNFSGHAEAVTDILPSPDGQRILSRSVDNLVLLWEISTGLISKRSLARRIAYSDDGPLSFNVFESDARSVVVGDVVTGDCLRRLGGRVDFITGVAFSPDANRLAVGGWSGATVWDLRVGQVTSRFQHPPTLNPSRLQATEGRWRQGKITSIAFSPDGSQVLTGGSDNRAILWDATTGRLVSVFHVESIVESVAFSPDGSKALMGTAKEVLVFEIGTGENIQRLEGHASQVTSLSLSRDGNRVLAGSSDSIIWDIKTGTPLQRLQPPRPHTGAAALSPDGSKALTGFKNFAILWECETGSILRWLMGRTEADAISDDDLRLNRGHEEPVLSVAFSPDGTRALTGGGDGTTIVWDLATGNVYRRFEGHTNAVSSACFSPDGAWVLTCSLDGTCRFWDLNSGAVICALVPFKENSWAVIDRQGRFDTDDLERQRGYGWVFDDDPFRGLPPEIFMRDYYEPRLLPRLLAGESFPSVPSLKELNRVQPMVTGLTAVRGDTADLVDVTVSVEGCSGVFHRGNQDVTMETDVYDLHLYRDGQLVGQWPAQAADTVPGAFDLERWREETRISGAGDSASATFSVRLPRNRADEAIVFSAYAFNEDRIKSQTRSVRYQPPESRVPVIGRAYVITVGVNAYENPEWDLRFAANDARLMQEVVGPWLKPYDLVLVSLISERRVTAEVGGGPKATKANVRKVIGVLAGRDVGTEELSLLPRGLRAATPDDLVLFFFAGHGYTDDAGTFFFFPEDIGADDKHDELSEDLLRRSISSTELSNWLRGVDSGATVMIIDTCHSEGAIEPPGFKLGPFGSRGLGQLAFDKGMQVLAASQTEGIALESASIEQGLLTYALIHDGLEQRRAAHDETITLSGWLNYGANRVPELYREVLTGEFRGLRPKQPADISSSPSIQQPALFDFAERKRPIVLVNPSMLPSDIGTLVEALRQLGVDEDLVNQVGKVLGEKAEDVGLWIELAVVLRQRKEYRAALVTYDVAMRRFPDSHVLWSNRGIVLLNWELYDEALEHFSRALEIQPNYVNALAHMAQTYERLGEFEVAAATYRRTLEIEPTHARAWNSLGACRLRLGDEAESIRLYKRSIELEPEFTDPLFNLAALYSSRREFSAALPCVMRLLEIDPYDYEARQLRDEILKAQQDQRRE